ncbi:MAG: hypothetical protein H6Q22_1725 [Bacteroidetes bacterium]|nr:hypothetical protein [Bacteroidota bacterium]
MNQIDRRGGVSMPFDFNTFLLLIIAVEVALIYVKIGKK